MARAKHASTRPSEAEQGGGKFTIPAGITAEIVDIAWKPWSEAGKDALKGGRQADDPALVITVSSDELEEDRTEFLGAGKANRLVASDDGEFLDVPEGSSASAIADGCNAHVFLSSLTDKKKQGKKAVPEDAWDDGISSLIGLQFVTGRKVVERENLDDDGSKRGKPRPVLYAEEVLALPTGKKSSGRKKGKAKDEDEDEDAAPARKRKARDEDEDEEPAPRKKKGKADDDDSDPEELAEKAVLAVLELPKFRKGLSLDKAFSAVYNQTKEMDLDKATQKAVGEQVEDEAWLKAKARPWSYDKEDDLITAVD